jgi:hypothetical protein
VRPFGSCDWAFDCHMVNLVVVFSLLSFVLEVHIGASSNCVDGSKGWEIVALLQRFWVLCRRRRQCVRLRLWLDCLGADSGVCYL